MFYLNFKLTLSLLFFLPLMGNDDSGFNKLYPIVKEYIKDFPKEFRKIPEERRYRLNEMVYFLEEQARNNEPWQFLFISSTQKSVDQMTQVWSRVAAYYYGMEKFQSFSGGLQAGAVTLNTILALEKSGFIVYKIELSGIEAYQVKYSYNLKPIVLFPKKINHIKNPGDEFMAIFVDENADLNTRNVKGTYNRLLLPYGELSAYDGSATDSEIYDESCRKIAVEMFYVFSQVRKRLKNP